MDLKLNNNQIYFNIKDGKVSIKSRGPLTLQEMIQVTMTGMLAALNQVVEATPEEDQAACKESLYDMFNIAASNTLTYFAPEIEMRPDLTTQAILRAEDEILEEEYKKREHSKKL